jgi:hypothetical protein
MNSFMRELRLRVRDSFDRWAGDEDSIVPPKGQPEPVLIADNAVIPLACYYSVRIAPEVAVEDLEREIRAGGFYFGGVLLKVAAPPPPA